MLILVRLNLEYCEDFRRRTMENVESNQFHGLLLFLLVSLCNSLPQICFLVLLHIKPDFPASLAVQGGHMTAPHQWNLRKSNSFKLF